MRIAYYVSNRTTFPPAPSVIAASTTVVLNLIKHLSGSHDITVYAAAGSAYPGVKIVDLGLPPFHADSNIANTDWTTKMALGMKQIYIGELFARAKEYDLIHLHTEPSYMAMPYAKLIPTPVLFTIHNEYHPEEAPIYSYYEDKVHFSGLSQNQVRKMPFKKNPPIVYNGIETGSLPFCEKDGGYFLFLGRLVADKGIDTFLELARKCPEHRFVIAGKGNPDFEKQITEQVKTTSNLQYAGMVTYQSEQWLQLVSRAKALLMPIRFEEPFGLNFLESMALGAPVIAYSRGAVPEIVRDGETGYIVNPSETDIRGNWTVKNTGIAGLSDALSRIASLMPAAYDTMRRQSRQLVLEKFTAKRMAQDYLNLYRQISGSSA